MASQQVMKPKDEQGFQSLKDKIDRIILEKVKKFLECREASKDGMPNSRDLNNKTWRDRDQML